MSFCHNSKDFSELYNIEEGTPSEENGFFNEDASDGNISKDKILVEARNIDSVSKMIEIKNSDSKKTRNRVSFSPNLQILHSSRSLGERSNKTLEYSVSVSNHSQGSKEETDSWSMSTMENESLSLKSMRWKENMAQRFLYAPEYINPKSTQNNIVDNFGNLEDLCKDENNSIHSSQSLPKSLKSNFYEQGIVSATNQHIPRRSSWAFFTRSSRECVGSPVDALNTTNFTQNIRNEYNRNASNFNGWEMGKELGAKESLGKGSNIIALNPSMKSFQIQQMNLDCCTKADETEAYSKDSDSKSSVESSTYSRKEILPKRSEMEYQNFKRASQRRSSESLIPFLQYQDESNVNKKSLKRTKSCSDLQSQLHILEDDDLSRASSMRRSRQLSAITDSFCHDCSDIDEDFSAFRNSFPGCVSEEKLEPFRRIKSCSDIRSLRQIQDPLGISSVSLKTGNMSKESCIQKLRQTSSLTNSSIYAFSDIEAGLGLRESFLSFQSSDWEKNSLRLQAENDTIKNILQQNEESRSHNFYPNRKQQSVNETFSCEPNINSSSWIETYQPINEVSRRKILSEIITETSEYDTEEQIRKGSTSGTEKLDEKSVESGSCLVVNKKKSLDENSERRVKENVDRQHVPSENTGLRAFRFHPYKFLIGKEKTLKRNALAACKRNSWSISSSSFQHGSGAKNKIRSKIGSRRSWSPIRRGFF